MKVALRIGAVAAALFVVAILVWQGVAAHAEREKAMQLTVRAVSQFLSVPESTVTRWIKQRGLPAQYVGGQYRFQSRDEMTVRQERGRRVAVERVQSEDLHAGISSVRAPTDFTPM